MLTIAIVNHSTRATSDLNATWLARLAQGLQNQMARDLCPDYGIAVPRVIVDMADDPADAELAIFDTSDQAGALGYHDVSPTGQPYAKVFADGQSSAQVETTASHEACELVVDQGADAYRLASNGIAYADEACDAVEDRSYPDQETGVLLSDYVLPAWYVIGSPGPWDKLGAVTSDHQMTSGGYWIEDDGGSVTTNPPEARARKGKDFPASRIARRLKKGAARARHHGDVLADLAWARSRVAQLESALRSQPRAEMPTPPPPARRVHVSELPAAAQPPAVATRRVHISELQGAPEPTPAAPAAEEPAAEGQEVEIQADAPKAAPAAVATTRRVHLSEIAGGDKG